MSKDCLWFGMQMDSQSIAKFHRDSVKYSFTAVATLLKE